MNAVTGALRTASNSVTSGFESMGSMMGAPRGNMPPQTNMPPTPPAQPAAGNQQTGGRRNRNRKSRVER